MWSLSLLFFGLLAVLPAAGAQAALSDPGMLLAGGLDQFNGPMATAEFYNFKTAAFSCKFLGGVNSATGACKNTLAQARFFASVAPLAKRRGADCRRQQRRRDMPQLRGDLQSVNRQVYRNR